MAVKKKSASLKHKVEPYSPLDIYLDKQNPRLRPEEQHDSQPELLEVLHERFKLKELGESIVASGYMPFDPIVCAKERRRVVVLEGNRRIATLQLLLDPGRAPSRYQDDWKTLEERLSPEHRQSIESIDVHVYGSRDDVDVSAYIGFRHVTSVLKWPAEEKAAYIAQLIEQQGWDYREVASRLGSYPAHVEKHYVAYRLVQQAQDDELDGADRMRDRFGVLLRALQATGVANYLGVTYPRDPTASVTPVPNDKHDEFSNFVAWTFGTDDRQRVLEDSRDVTRWGKILQDKGAIRYLSTAKEPSIERAWQKCGGESESLVETLWEAATRLEDSVPLVSRHSNNEELQEAVAECKRFLDLILGFVPIDD